MDSSSSILFVYLVCLLNAYSVNSADIFGKTLYPPDVIEDGELDTHQLIKKYNYPVETHYITTEDNYTLRVHRIARPGGQPILLQHGLLDSSVAYVIMGPTHGLGYYLYDKGYDVWLGNARGNRYSRNHTTLNPDSDSAFWNFSWHEIAIYDIPAMIDYILNKTNSERLFYGGHSQGTTVLFIMCSMRPEYNQKIILAHALAPVAFMKHIRAPITSIAENYIKLITNRKREFLPHSNLLKNMCLNGKQMEDSCIRMGFRIMGKSTEQFNRTKLPTILGHIPAGAAIMQVLHYYQLVKSDQFRQYDYEQDNQKVYSQATPPNYDLDKVTVPIALYYGSNDYLTEPIDIIRLSKKLPNVVKLHKMDLPQWNHMDFLYAIDARKLLYESIEEFNREYDVSNKEK